MAAPLPASISYSHALALHGTPKYPPDWQAATTVNAEAPQGGEWREAIIGSFDTLNRYQVKGTPAAGLHLLQDTLLARSWDEPFSLYALVAEGVALDNDRQWLAFKLNKAARFHDGSPITTKDVLFTFNLLREKGKPFTRESYKAVQEVKIISPQEIVFFFNNKAERETPMLLGMMPIFPEHYWQGHDFSATGFEAPLSSGPYKVAQVEAGKRIIYEKVNDYWAKDLPVNRGFYNVERVIYEYFRDESVAFEAFKAGTLNVRRENDWGRSAASYQDNLPDGMHMEDIPHQRPEAMRGFIFNLRRPLFQDMRVRRAFSVMFDAGWVAENFFHGLVKPINSFYPNSVLAASTPLSPQAEAILSPILGQLPEDVQENMQAGGCFWQPQPARQRLKLADNLLAQAGFVVKDGERQKNGEKLNFEILLSDHKDEKIALYYAEQLAKLGIDVRVRTADSTSFQGRVDRFDYDMVLHRWISTLSPGVEQRGYFGSNARDSKGSRNYAGLASKGVDLLIDGLTRQTSREGLEANAQALDKTLGGFCLAIPLFYRGVDRMAWWDSIKRPAITPLYGVVTESWWNN
ncbi:MAG: extracellular solute-binding protein [Alphaproteobacteria bacterium]